MIDAINQVFALFRVNFHNQYFSAYPTVEDQNMAKRLWLDNLKPFSVDNILRGAKKVITQSDYLPTIHKMITACQSVSSQGALPDTHAAYIEACNASSPKAEYNWSHLAVYYAGKEADWYFLASNTEQKALPVFAQCYQRICARVLAGETLEPPKPIALPERTEKTLSKDENHKRLSALRSSLDI